MKVGVNSNNVGEFSVAGVLCYRPLSIFNVNLFSCKHSNIYGILLFSEEIFLLELKTGS